MWSGSKRSSHFSISSRPRFSFLSLLLGQRASGVGLPFWYESEGNRFVNTVHAFVILFAATVLGHWHNISNTLSTCLQDWPRDRFTWMQPIRADYPIFELEDQTDKSRLCMRANDVSHLKFLTGNPSLTPQTFSDYFSVQSNSWHGGFWMQLPFPWKSSVCYGSCHVCNVSWCSYYYFVLCEFSFSLLHAYFCMS